MNDISRCQGAPPGAKRVLALAALIVVSSVPSGWSSWLSSMLSRCRSLVLAVTAAACASQFPAEFTPDPATIERIVEIRMRTGSDQVCPGETITASYDAVFDDGGVLPFASDFDRKDPPQLHVSLLELTSPEATATEDGSWIADPDPLASAMTGFRLSASLRTQTSVNVTQVVKPQYSCLDHTFSFEGTAGAVGSTGGPGPNVVVRLAALSSPFYDRLLVAGIEVGSDPPRYTLADMHAVSSSHWLVVESKGGRGGQGTHGRNGREGAPSQRYGVAGGRGENGGLGGAGGAGGRGGQITVILPTEQPLPAELVKATTTGGGGGAGGVGGFGGSGGAGVAEVRDSTGAVICRAGRRGSNGNHGAAGPPGRSGNPGPALRLYRLPRHEVLGANLPPMLQELIEFTRRRSGPSSSLMQTRQ
jgi:hypothetical protein